MRPTAGAATATATARNRPLSRRSSGSGRRRSRSTRRTARPENAAIEPRARPICPISAFVDAELRRHRRHREGRDLRQQERARTAIPGTRAAPKREIQAGVLAAALAGKDVYVGGGDYARVETVSGVDVYGGYLSTHLASDASTRGRGSSGLPEAVLATGDTVVLQLIDRRRSRRHRSGLDRLRRSARSAAPDVDAAARRTSIANPGVDRRSRRPRRLSSGMSGGDGGRGESRVVRLPRSARIGGPGGAQPGRLSRAATAGAAGLERLDRDGGDGYPGKPDNSRWRSGGANGNPGKPGLRGSRRRARACRGKPRQRRHAPACDSAQRTWAGNRRHGRHVRRSAARAVAAAAVAAARKAAS